MITHFAVRNYKSLANVNVDLGQLTILVGPNGAGKSSFIDALNFVSESVAYDPERAIVTRGGMTSILPVSQRDLRPDITFEMKFRFGEQEGEFSFTLDGTAGSEDEPRIKQERCVIGGKGYEYESSTQAVKPVGIRTDHVTMHLSSRHVLMTVGSIFDEVGLAEIRDDILNRSHYEIVPDSLRKYPQEPTFAYRLLSNAWNLSSVLRHMKDSSVESFSRLSTALSSAVPDVTSIDVRKLERYLLVEFHHVRNGETDIIDLAQESDGTIRLLAILTALYQTPPLNMISLEEPELNIHPAALKALYEAIKESSLRSQIIISTHSPELVYFSDPADLRVVDKVHGQTVIGNLDDRQVQIINEKLFSTSDLLRVEGLQRQPSGQDH